MVVETSNAGMTQEDERPTVLTVSQEEEPSDGERKDTAKPVKKRRRSLRNTNASIISYFSAPCLCTPHFCSIPAISFSFFLFSAKQRIVLPDKSSLQGRRLDEFFFQQGQQSSETIQVGSLTLERVHSSPNVYVIDNFLSTTELGTSGKHHDSLFMIIYRSYLVQ